MPTEDQGKQGLSRGFRNAKDFHLECKQSQRCLCGKAGMLMEVKEAGIHETVRG